MPYILQSEGKSFAAPQADIKTETSVADASLSCVKISTSAPAPHSVCIGSCAFAVHMFLRLLYSPPRSVSLQAALSVSPSAATSPDTPFPINDGGSPVSRVTPILLACATSVSGFVSADKRLMRDVLDTRRQASVGLGSATVAASPAPGFEGLSEFGSRFVANLKSRGIRLSRKKIDQARMNVEQLEALLRELHGADISMRYADYAVDETVWAKDQGKDGLCGMRAAALEIWIHTPYLY